ncbi:hypothetical protein FS837_003420 [Tulasnella sp. UAMH 9824]|nr:hypothetical protein FS837_003420 [Tulasnella sp. UAMH 9824]
MIGTGKYGSTVFGRTLIAKLDLGRVFQCLAGTVATTTTTTTTTKTTTTSLTTTTTTSKTSSTTSKTTPSTTSTSSGIPSGAITVGKNGAGKYATITEALADTSSNIIYIYPGNYTEQVVISRSGIKIYGQTSNKLAYSSNTVTISRYMSAATAGSNDASGTVRVLATGVSLYNLNIENTFGKGAQAIALSVQAGTFGCYACQLRGYQDTLYANKGTQFYGKCFISGATDFIFGSAASIWVTGSTIQTIANGYITASGRSSDDANYYVIDSTTVTGTGTSNYARVIFQNSNLGSNVPAAGWTQWSTATPNTDYILFGEYNNSGAGAWNSARASFATLLTAPISITTVLGSTSWVDATYL